MSQWVDIERLKSQVDVQQVLNYYSIEFVQQGDDLVCACPLPHHAGDRSSQTAFRFSLSKKIFNCLSHCGGGNIFDFVRLMENLPADKAGIRQTGLFMQEKFLAGHPIKKLADKKDIPSQSQEAAEDKEQFNQPLDFELHLKHDHPFLIETKGFPLELMEQFDIGWCKVGMHAGKIAYAMHDLDGNRIGYVGRALTKKDIVLRKYNFPSNIKKSWLLWNYHRVTGKNKLLREKGLIIVEGFHDVLRLIQYGIPNVVALMGWSLSDEQQSLILSLTDKITLFLHNDEAGKKGTRQAHQSLIHQAFVKVINYPADLPDKTQPEHFTQAELSKILAIKKIKQEEQNNGGS